MMFFDAEADAETFDMTALRFLKTVVRESVLNAPVFNTNGEQTIFFFKAAVILLRSNSAALEIKPFAIIKLLSR